MKRWTFLLLAGMLLLTGCSQVKTEEPVPADAVPVVSRDAEGKVVAEAVIEPAHWSELRFTSGGTVVEVLVEPGDEVAAGDLLVRLDPTGAELAVQEAEAALASAEAQLALTEAEPRPEEIAAAEAQLEAALAALSRATAEILRRCPTRAAARHGPSARELHNCNQQGKNRRQLSLDHHRSFYHFPTVIRSTRRFGAPGPPRSTNRREKGRRSMAIAETVPRKCLGAEVTCLQKFECLRRVLGKVGCHKMLRHVRNSDNKRSISGVNRKLLI